MFTQISQSRAIDTIVKIHGSAAILILEALIRAAVCEADDDRVALLDDTLKHIEQIMAATAVSPDE